MMTRMRFVAVSVYAAIVLCSYSADAQDLSRYRDVAFGSSVSSVVALTGTNAGAVKVVHERPALIQEIAWRPQYVLGRPAGRIEAVQVITLRFYDDQLFSVTVVYDARLVEGLTNLDIIDAVSAVYGPAALTAAASKGPALPLAGTINSSTALARWQNADHEFTLMREVYPATFRLIGVSRRLEAVARAAEAEAARLDKQEAPQREAERAVADAERKRAAEDKTRTTNKGEFRP
ncbi:MAG: hypothetical protein ACRD3C_01015 [Vicinamibacterales bacterium]